MNSDTAVKILDEIDKIILFKKLKKNQLLNDLRELLKAKKPDQNSVNNLIYQLVEFNESQGISGDLWHNYLKSLIISSENIFSLSSEKEIIKKEAGLYQLALNDLKIINQLFRLSLTDLLNILKGAIPVYLKNYKLLQINQKNNRLYQKLFKSSDPEKNLEDLNKFYFNCGVSILNQSRAFFWQNNELKAVANPDQISFEQIISYQKQKNRLIENTKSFLRGRKAHNVLLYGDSGTGKSSSVKALLNNFFDQGLRLIEINSFQIKELPEILEFLSKRGLYFIIFMDDLSFEEFETDYKYLKAVMEGGIESRPDNVLFYATSNRRHLVREKWQDRESEIHENDILNEKLSLSERFGLTLMYNSPAQEEYLKIVKELARQENILLDQQRLEERALEWSRWNNGRSGRTARQFIDQLLNEEF